MMTPEEAEFFLCPNCFSPGRSAGPCENCGTQVLHCRPGEADDPCRKPLMNALGEVKTRAPLWWLQKNLPALAKYYDSSEQR